MIHEFLSGMTFSIVGDLFMAVWMCIMLLPKHYPFEYPFASPDGRADGLCWSILLRWQIADGIVRSLFVY